MRLFKAVLDWYIRGSLHVSLALISLVIFTSRVMEVPVSSHYYLALFFGSISAYNGIKYGLEPAKHSSRVPGGLRALAVFSLICLIMALYHLRFLPLHSWMLLLVCAAISAVYAIPVIPGNRNLRSIGLLKVFLVSLVWTLATLWIPVWGKVPAGTWDLYVESFQRILWVVLLMLPFEIRDMHLDPPFLRTIPQRWGIRGTRRAAWIGVVVFAGASWLKDSPVEGELLSKALTGLMMGLSTAFAAELQPRYFASLWVESIPLVSLVLLILLGG